MTNGEKFESELGFSTISDLNNDLQEKQLSPQELVFEFTHRINEIDDCQYGLNSVLAISSNLDKQINSIDISSTNKPLNGIPVFIKDNIEAVGLPATAGSLALVGRTVKSDSKIVSTLRNAGAVILGSTNLSEWANFRSSNSTSGWSAIGGLTGNPWNYKHSAGGSSSGSGAAVAAGLVPVAIGTETDGSIVCPAALNGVVGIKPSVGSVSTQGVIPLSFSQDSPGPIARNVVDAVTVLEILQNRSDLKINLTEERKIKIGVVRKWLTEDDKTNAVFENQIHKLALSGFNLVEIEISDILEEVGADEITVLVHELKYTLDSYLSQRPGNGVKSLSDVIKFNLNNSAELIHFGQEYFLMAQNTVGLAQEYLDARMRNLNWAKNTVLDPAFEKADILIGVPYGPAWKSDLVNGDNYASASWMTHPAAISGYPIASIPMGFVDDLPVGMGLIAKANDELSLVQALYQLEKEFDLFDLVPNFVR